ncbi:MAG: hypothetical protein FWD57_14470 [Polyangiaceae bacterium]|nr:hypothetical protein [Polyangiaceae bacterium]
MSWSVAGAAGVNCWGGGAGSLCGDADIVVVVTVVAPVATVCAVAGVARSKVAADAARQVAATQTALWRWTPLVLVLVDMLRGSPARTPIATVADFSLDC